MKSILGLGKLIRRMVLLKAMDNTDDSEKAMVGNTILVAQPSPEMIAAELPPTEAVQTKYFNVVYAAGAAEHGSNNLSKKKALTIDSCKLPRYGRMPQLMIQTRRCRLLRMRPLCKQTTKLYWLTIAL